MTSLREALLGAWELMSFIALDDATGEERLPLGAAPRGLILYTADGFMSAQLAKPDMDEYVAYGGRFAIDEKAAIIHHDVTMSMMPELLVQKQFRRAGVNGDLLTLSATTDAADGTSTHARLVWRRAGTNSTGD